MDLLKIEAEIIKAFLLIKLNSLEELLRNL